MSRCFWLMIPLCGFLGCVATHVVGFALSEVVPGLFEGGGVDRNILIVEIGSLVGLVVGVLLVLRRCRAGPESRHRGGPP